MENVQKKKIALACVALVIALATLITVICLVAPRKMSSAVSSKNIDYVKVSFDGLPLPDKYETVEKVLSEEEEKTFVDELNNSKYTKSYQSIKRMSDLNIYVYYTDGSYIVFNSCRLYDGDKSIEFASTTFDFNKFASEDMRARYEEILKQYDEDMLAQAEEQNKA